MQYRSYGRVWVEKGMAQDGYKLYVHTSKDIDPRSIQVSIVGRTVIIESKQSFQQEERNDRGIYSYSRSSTNFRRRFSIPRNADTENMSRTESGGVITITLPFLHPNPNYQ
jgi:HSP20 family molecular chaperone IbpA